MLVHNGKRSKRGEKKSEKSKRFCKKLMHISYLGSNTKISLFSVPIIRQLHAGSFHESLLITPRAVTALFLIRGILLYCSAKLIRKFTSIDKNFKVRGEMAAAPSSFNNESRSSANVSTFSSSSRPALCHI